MYDFDSAPSELIVPPAQADGYWKDMCAPKRPLPTPAALEAARHKKKEMLRHVEARISLALNKIENLRSQLDKPEALKKMYDIYNRLQGTVKFMQHKDNAGAYWCHFRQQFCEDLNHFEHDIGIHHDLDLHLVDHSIELDKHVQEHARILCQQFETTINRIDNIVGHAEHKQISI